MIDYWSCRACKAAPQMVLARLVEHVSLSAAAAWTDNLAPKPCRATLDRNLPGHGCIVSGDGCDTCCLRVRRCQRCNLADEHLPPLVPQAVDVGVDAEKLAVQLGGIWCKIMSISLQCVV